MSARLDLFSNLNWILNFTAIFAVYCGVRVCFHRTPASALCVAVSCIGLAGTVLVAWREEMLQAVYVENIIIACFTAVVCVAHFVKERRKAAKGTR